MIERDAAAVRSGGAPGTGEPRSGSAPAAGRAGHAGADAGAVRR